MRERERKQLLQSTCYLHEKKQAVRKYQLINGNLLKTRVVAQHLKNVPQKTHQPRAEIRHKSKPSLILPNDVNRRATARFQAVEFQIPPFKRNVRSHVTNTIELTMQWNQSVQTNNNTSNEYPPHSCHFAPG